MFAKKAGFGKKECLSSPGLGWKFFNTIIVEDDEPIYIIFDNYMRWFVQQAVNGGRVNALNQCSYSKLCNNKLGYLATRISIHQKLGSVNLSDLLMDLDATCLYPSAVRDDKSTHPLLETGYAFTPDVNEDLTEKFNSENFNEGSANIELEYYNPPDLIFQHLPVKDQKNRTQIGYLIHNLTSVDNKEIIRIGGKLIKRFEEVIFKEDSRVNNFPRVLDKKFELRKSYKERNDEVIKFLVELLMNSLYGEQIGKDIEDEYL